MVNTQNGYFEYSEHLEERAEQELVQTIWPMRDVTYPWNPLSPESEDYLASLEEEFTLDDWSEAEIETRSQVFFSQLKEIIRLENVPNTTLQRLQACLSDSLRDRVPLEWLNAIATKASGLIASDYPAPGLSLMDRMVRCVEDLLPNWNQDDLQVLARPLAFAMRGSRGETVDIALGVVRPLDWTELSEIERARLSLAVAQIALAELETTDG